MSGAANADGAAPAGEAPFSPLGTIDALQALRAAAALLVVLDHALVAASNGGLIGAGIRPFAIYIGHLGVYVFFTVSGFVMVFSHGDDFDRPGAPLRFLARRIGRIMPLHWLTTLAVAPLRPETVSGWTLILSLLLIPHQMIGGSFGWPLYVPAWTLQYELFFYLLFAVALLLPRSRGLALLAIALVAAVAAGTLGLLGRDNAAAYLAHPVLLYFLAGAALGVAGPRVPEAWRPGFATALTIAAAAVAACAAAALAWGPVPLRVLLLTAAAPVAATAACALSSAGGPPTRTRRAARAIGDSTYSIYMVHPFLVFPLGPFAARHAPAMPWPLLVLLALGISVAAGLLTYRWVEKPLVRAFGRLLGQRPRIGGHPV
jgi:peptidoglycan/LPS O-acetylase OafA/YrhL